MLQKTKAKKEQRSFAPPDSKRRFLEIAMDCCFEAGQMLLAARKDPRITAELWCLWFNIPPRTWIQPMIGRIIASYSTGEVFNLHEQTRMPVTLEIWPGTEAWNLLFGGPARGNGIDDDEPSYWQEKLEYFRSTLLRCAEWRGKLPDNWERKLHITALYFVNGLPYQRINHIPCLEEDPGTLSRWVRETLHLLELPPPRAPFEKARFVYPSNIKSVPFKK
jgi:hypothetical protein